LTTFQNRVDLHSHTTASDGGMAPEELVARAAELGIEVLAITDHDTTDGISPAVAEAQRWNITVVPGIEISTLSGRDEIHLLGYFVNLDSPELQAMLLRARAARLERAQGMLARLASFGLAVEWERLVEIAGKSRAIGRPHVAATLLEAGHVSSYNEAFDLWIGRGCPAYVERLKLSPEDAIQLVRNSGGVPVLAHPYIYDRNGAFKTGLNLNRWLPRLREAGLVGVEVYYPHYPHRIIRQLLAMAIQNRLLITGGSDFHGGFLGNGLGSVAVPWAVWKGLERRHCLDRARPNHYVQGQGRPAADFTPGQVIT
jgi:predicted metal-dependent phosphoesterase TrpH